jgi:hypothetical protein
MTPLGLTINDTKTSLKDARRERFDFLGIRSELTDIKQMVLGI